MTDIASLSIAIDSSPVGKAKQYLDELTAAGDKTEAGIKRLTIAQQALNFQMAAAKDKAETTAKIEARNAATAALVNRIQDQIAVEKQAEATASAMGDKIESLVLKYISWTAAIAAVTSVLKQMWQQGHEAAVVELRMDNVLRAVGATSGRTADQLNKLADSISAVTRFDDTAIKQGMTTMLKFSSVHSETFDRAIKVAVKYAEMSGHSLEASSQQIGRALEAIASGRGSGGLRGLEEQFGKLTSTQRNYIDELVKLGQATEAQNYLLGIMNTKLGDIDTEMAGAGVNSVSMFKKAWKELMEELGKPPKEGGVLDWFINKGAESIANWARFLKDDGGAVKEGRLRSALESQLNSPDLARAKEAQRQLTQLNNDALDRQIERDLIEGAKRDRKEEDAAKETARRAQELKTEEWKKGAAKRKGLHDKQTADEVASFIAQEKIMEEAQKLGNDFLKKQGEEQEKMREAARQINLKGEVAMYEAIVQADFDATARIAQDEIAAQDKVTAATKKATEERTKQYEKQAEEVDRLLGDALMRGFERGEDSAKNFRDSLVNMFKTLVLRPIISWVMSPITGAVTSALTSAGLSSSGSSLLSTGSSLYSGASKLSGLFSTEAPAWYTAGVADGTIAASTTAAVTSGTGAAGTAAAGWVSAEGGAAYAGTAATGAGMTVASVIPWVAAAIAAYYLLSDDDDERQKDLIATGVAGKISSAGLQGNVVSTWGTGADDAWGGTTSGAIPAAALAAINNSIDQIFTNMSTAAVKMGLSVTGLDSVMVDFGASWTNGNQTEADLTRAFNATSDVIAEKLIPNIRELQYQGESLTDTFSRLAQEAAVLADQRLTMEIRLMELQGKTVEALAATRKRELEALDPTLRALQEQIYAAEDLATAVNDATGAIRTLADIANERQNLQDQLDELTMTQLELIAKQRNAYDESNRVLFDQVVAAQEAADAQEELTRAQERAAEVNKRLADAATALRGGNLSPLTAGSKLTEAGTNLDAVFAKAGAGDLTARGEFSSVATTFLEMLRAMYASGPQYTAGFERVMGMFAQLGVSIPGHAGGIGYVPRDNYLMRAHQGEAVLAAPEATRWRGGASNDDRLRGEIRALREEVSMLRGDVRNGDVMNARATAASGDRAARAVEDAAWRSDVLQPKVA